MATPGQAVPGSVVAIGSQASPAGAQGIQGPTGVSADAGNIATLGSDSLVLVPQSTLWYQRLRSYNAIGNPTFEVDQRNVGGGVAGNAMSIDRWYTAYSATMASWGGGQTAGNIVVPGTNFCITQKFLRITTTGVVASVPAAGYLYHQQVIEGIGLRELINDVHSLQVLVRSSVAGLKFSLALQNSAGSYSLTELCTIPTANTWTLLPFPNIPVWPGAGNFSTAPGAIGYFLLIVLVAGSTYTSPANGSWQNGGFFGAAGMDNFLSKPSGSTFDIAFCQHEPGSQCSTPIDKTFAANYDECLRFYSKSYGYLTPIGVAGFHAAATFSGPGTTAINGPVIFPKRMANAPTGIGIYNPSSGAANSIYNASSGAATPISSAAYISDAGFLQLQGTFAAATQYLAQWTADTGW